MRRIGQNNHVNLSFFRQFLIVLVRILFPVLVIGRHYHNSGPEKMRTANSKFFLAGPYLF